MPSVTLNTYIQDEIARVSELHSISSDILKDFALFVTKNYEKPDPKPKKLNLTQLKAIIYKEFSVKDTPSLKKSSSYQAATSNLPQLNLAKTESWEAIYREVIGILPHEENETGYGCINGVDIFKYALPWKVFDLDPQKASTDDIKSAYRQLSKVYHPDNPKTGDAKIFDRLTTFYNSLTFKF